MGKNIFSLLPMTLTLCLAICSPSNHISVGSGPSSSTYGTTEAHKP